jgi:Zn-finger nucleic acid-binding protein
VVTADLAADLKHGKLDKSVAIDACPSCFIFWFDKTELMRVTANDVTTKSKNPDVNIAPPNTQPTSGVVTVSKSEVK